MTEKIIGTIKGRIKFDVVLYKEIIKDSWKYNALMLKEIIKDSWKYNEELKIMLCRKCRKEIKKGKEKRENE